MPGTPYRSRSWSSRFWRARRVAGDAVRAPPMRRRDGDGGDPRARRERRAGGRRGRARARRTRARTTGERAGAAGIGVGRAAPVGSAVRDALSTGPSAIEARLVTMRAARIRRARRTRVRRGRAAAMRSARYPESVTGTIPRMRDVDGPLSAPGLLRAVGLLPDGPLPWGRPVPGRSRASSSWSSPEPLPTAPIELTRVGKWLEHVPGLLLDGAAPHVARAGRPSRVVLAAVARPCSTSGRPPRRSADGWRRWARTTLGDRRPYAGGHWLKTLRTLPSTRVWWAATEAIEEYEDALLAAFAAAVPAAERAALPDPDGRAAVRQPATPDRRAQGERPVRVAAARAGRGRRRRRRGSSSLPDGDAEGARGEPARAEAARASRRRRRPRRRRHGPVAAGALGARIGPPAGGAADGHARRSGRDPDGRGRRAAARRARRADRGEAAAGHRPDPGRQGARRPQGERGLQLRPRGAVVPGGARPGHRGAAAHAVIAVVPAAGSGADLGSRVTVEVDGATDTYTLVGSAEADPRRGGCRSPRRSGARCGRGGGRRGRGQDAARRRDVPGAVGRLARRRAVRRGPLRRPGRRRACARPRRAPPGSATRGRACPGCSRRRCGRCAR